FAETADDQIADASNVAISAGSLALGSHSDTVHGVQLTGGANISGSGTLTSSTNFDLQNGTVGANLAGSVGLVKESGNTVTLSGNNTYTGNTTVGNGTLAITGNNALGSTGNGTTV